MIFDQRRVEMIAKSEMLLQLLRAVINRGRQQNYNFAENLLNIIPLGDPLCYSANNGGAYRAARFSRT